MTPDVGCRARVKSWASITPLAVEWPNVLCSAIVGIGPTRAEDVSAGGGNWEAMRVRLQGKEFFQQCPTEPRLWGSHPPS